MTTSDRNTRQHTQGSGHLGCVIQEGIFKWVARLQRVEQQQGTIRGSSPLEQQWRTAALQHQRSAMRTSWQG